MSVRVARGVGQEPCTEYETMVVRPIVTRDRHTPRDLTRVLLASETNSAAIRSPCAERRNVTASTTSTRTRAKKADADELAPEIESDDEVATTPASKRPAAKKRSGAAGAKASTKKTSKKSAGDDDVDDWETITDKVLDKKAGDVGKKDGVSLRPGGGSTALNAKVESAHVESRGAKTKKIEEKNIPSVTRLKIQKKKKEEER